MATNKESLIVRLRAACNGLPGAVIAWPHRILHEAAEELAAANARIAELEARCAKYKADSTRLDKLQESFIKGEEFHIVMCEGKNEDEQCEHDTHPHFEAFDWSWRGEPARASTLRDVIDKALAEGGNHEQRTDRAGGERHSSR